MRDETRAALAARQETVAFGGHHLVVRELPIATDLPEMEGRTVRDLALDLIVLCAYEASGEPAFTAADLPELQAAGRRQMRPLIDAALRVNGLDIKAEVKNSDAGPDAG